MSQFRATLRYILVLHSLISVDASVAFSALIHDAWYVNELYAKEWNEDENTEQDPATADASARLQICEDIGLSGIIEHYGMRSVSAEDVHDELRQPKYSHIFHRLYSRSEGSGDSYRPYTYTNPYTLEEFQITRYAYGAETLFMNKCEYVFVCLLRRINYFDELSSGDNPDDGSSGYLLEEGTRKDYPVKANFERETTENSWQRPARENEDRLSQRTHEKNAVGVGLGKREITKVGESTDLNAKLNEGNLAENRPGDIIPVYITKAYDQKMGLHVHRYIHLDSSKFDGDELMLAERSANAHSRPDFNIELHYLELWKHHRPALTILEDLIPRYSFSEQSSERLSRVCTMVATSSYFQDKFGKVRSAIKMTIWEGAVSFRTDAGKRKAGKRSYREQMVICRVFMSNNHVEYVYISRAYNPFQVFLYLEHPLSRELYLEMLATDVSAAQDRHNLGDVEI